MPTLDWIGKDAVIRHHKDVSFRLLEADEALFVMVKEKDWASIKEKI